MFPILVTAIGLAAAPAFPARTSAADDCRYTAERTATIAASGISTLELEAGAGSLRIIGRSGISQIQVRGRACASSTALLGALQLRANRSGTTYAVEMLAPENTRKWNDDGSYARIDLVIEVPASMVARVSDGSGEAIISGIAGLDMDDGSGELEVTNVGGDVTIEDGSGELEITGVQGDVVVEDGSGEVTIRDVTGSVTVSDGSGSIRVAQVGGNFTVRSDGSGDVQESGVSGTVRVPGRDRRRDRQAAFWPRAVFADTLHAWRRMNDSHGLRSS